MQLVAAAAAESAVAAAAVAALDVAAAVVAAASAAVATTVEVAEPAHAAAVAAPPLLLVDNPLPAGLGCLPREGGVANHPRTNWARMNLPGRAPLAARLVRLTAGTTPYYQEPRLTN